MGKCDHLCFLKIRRDAFLIFIKSPDFEKKNGISSVIKDISSVIGVTIKDCNNSAVPDTPAKEINRMINQCSNEKITNKSSLKCLILVKYQIVPLL